MEKNGHILSRCRLVMRLLLAALLAGPPAAAFYLPPAYALEAAGTATLDQVLHNIKQREQSLKTFTASFRQVQHNSLLQEPLVSEGMLFYDRSGSILMKISRPESFLLLIRDRTLIMGDPATKTFKQRRLPGRDSFVKRYLGTGQSIAALKESYDIRIVRGDAGTDLELELSPKDPSAKMPFRAIRLTVDSSSWLPEVILLEEASGDHTVFELTYHTLNDPLPADTFSIEMPKVTDDAPRDK